MYVNVVKTTELMINIITKLVCNVD